MGASSFTNRLGLPIYTGTDTVDPLNEVNAGNRAADTKAALATDAPIPCTAAYDTATKRHTLTPIQTGITMPDIFTARFLATTAFTAGDKVYIGGAEYVTSYTDGDTAVETGAWIVGAVVSLDCKKAGLKAYVGAGFGTQLSHKANLSGADFSGHVKVPSGGLTIKAAADVGGIFYLETRPNLGTIAGNKLVIDTSNGLFRVWEGGGENRGFHINISKCAPVANSPLATATPPQEFDLLFASGWSAAYNATASVFKTQDQIVTINGILQCSNNATDGMMIFSLPAAYLPKKAVIVRITIFYQDGTTDPALVSFESGGAVKLFGATKRLPISSLSIPTTSFIANH